MIENVSLKTHEVKTVPLYEFHEEETYNEKVVGFTRMYSFTFTGKLPMEDFLTLFSKFQTWMEYPIEEFKKSFKDDLDQYSETSFGKVSLEEVIYTDEGISWVVEKKVFLSEYKGRLF